MALPERVGGFLIDLDGTVIEGGELIPGAAEALTTLVQKKIPYRIVTNTTSKPRSAILAKLNALGLELQPEQVITAPIIGRDYLRRQGITRCFPLLKPSLLEDLTAIEFVETSPQAVLIGKPAQDFFLLACESMGVPCETTVVIGDDLEADVGGAKAAGCIGVLVQTGKFRPDQIEKSKIGPDAILGSLACLPSWVERLAMLCK